MKTKSALIANTLTGVAKTTSDNKLSLAEQVKALLLNKECRLHTPSNTVNIIPLNIFHINGENGIVSGKIKITDIQRFISMQSYIASNKLKLTEDQFINIEDEPHTYVARAKESSMVLSYLDHTYIWNVVLNRVKDDVFNFIGQIRITDLNKIKGGIKDGKESTRLLKESTRGDGS